MSLNKLDKKADIISFDPFLKERSGGRCLDCQTTALQTCCAPLHFLGKLFVLDVLYFLPLRNCSLKPHITTGSDSFKVIVKHCNLNPEGLAECKSSFFCYLPGQLLVPSSGLGAHIMSRKPLYSLKHRTLRPPSDVLSTTLRF